MGKRQLKVLKLIEPEICLECRFAQLASVEMEDGPPKQMIYCTRLDCDNWDCSDLQTPKKVNLYGDKENG